MAFKNNSPIIYLFFFVQELLFLGPTQQPRATIALLSHIHPYNFETINTLRSSQQINF